MMVGSNAQAFLFGDNLYLRPVEPDDAGTAAIWRENPFPEPVDVVRDALKTSLDIDPDDAEAERTLLICCRLTDQALGSVRLRVNGERFGRIEPSIDPLLPDARQTEIVAETARILIPWLLEECHLMTVIMRVAGEHLAVDEVVRQLGGKTAYRLREMYLIDGRRTDCLVYQWFNPVWVERLGPAPEPNLTDGAVHGQVQVRIGRAVSGTDRPRDALSVGERVYLRAFRPEEGALVAKWSMQETQVYRPGGRAVFGGYAYGEFHNRLARQDPPVWVRFAIADRQTGELLGCAGLDMISWVHRCATSEVVYFRPEHRGAGYSAESSMLTLEYGFGVLGMHSIHAFVSDFNPRSLGAIRKRGYRDCGYLAWRSLGPDGLSGNFVFDMLDREWHAAREHLRESLENDPADREQRKNRSTALCMAKSPESA